jgi:hypothetical protein
MERRVSVATGCGKRSRLSTARSSSGGAGSVVVVGFAALNPPCGLLQATGHRPGGAAGAVPPALPAVGSRRSRSTTSSAPADRRQPRRAGHQQQHAGRLGNQSGAVHVPGVVDAIITSERAVKKAHVKPNPRHGGRDAGGDQRVPLPGSRMGVQHTCKRTAALPARTARYAGRAAAGAAAAGSATGAWPGLRCPPGPSLTSRRSAEAGRGRICWDRDTCWGPCGAAPYIDR